MTRTLCLALAVLALPAFAQFEPANLQPVAPAPAEAAPPAATPAPAAPEASIDEWAQWSDRKAYRGGILAFSWLPAFPVGNLATATPNATVHGLELDTRVAVKKGLTLGITGSWNNFWTRQDRATYSYPSGAVTAQLWRYYETFQLRGTIHYHFVVDRKLPLVPYAGVGLGFASNRYEILAADLSLERFQTNFAMTVDVGTLIDLRFARSFGAGALVAFRYGFNTAKFTQPSLDTPMNLGLVIGLYSSF